MVSKVVSKKYTKRQASSDVVSSPWVNELAATIVTGNKLQTVSAKGYDIIDHSTGELSNLQAIQATRRVIDKTEFVKVYSSGIVAMFDLSKSAQDMFKVIMTMYLDQKHKPDSLFINEDSLADYGYKKSRTTRTGALNQLIASQFVAPHAKRKGIYFINPNMFYKGDRMTIVNEYAVAGTSAGAALKEDIAKVEREENQIGLPFGKQEVEND